MKKNIIISAIICTYNRANYLSKAVSSLVDQTILQENFEIIVIDNCSTDNTRQIVEDFQLKFQNIRYFFEAKQGLSAARNRGIKEAKGELIAFLDDDAVACREWLEEFIAVFQDYPEAGCAGGKINLLWPEGRRPEWMPERFETFYGKLDKGNVIKLMKYPEIPFGGNLCIKKEIFDLRGCFNENLGRKQDILLSNEELEFVDRIRKYNDIIYVPEALIYHHVLPFRVNEKYIINRFYWQGRSDIINEFTLERDYHVKQIYRDIRKLIKYSPIFNFIYKHDINCLVEFQYHKGRIIQTIIEILKLPLRS